MRTMLRGALVAIAASVIALAVAQLALLWLPAQALFHVDSALHGVVALALALPAALFTATVAGTPRARSAPVRVAAAALAIACAIGLAWVFVTSGDPAWTALTASILGAGLAFGAWASARPPREVALGRMRGAVIALSIAASLAWGQVYVRDAWDEYRSEPLSRFTIELVAAYPYDVAPPPGAMRSIVVAPDGSVGDVVSLEGGQFNLHRGDALRIDSTDVRRARWIADGELRAITLRLADGARESFAARARSRASQYDAVLVDGAPSLLLFYVGGPDDRVALFSRDAHALARVYAHLTGRR